MRRTLYLCMVAGLAWVMCASLAGAQSLGEVARQQRQQKRPSTAKVITNDDVAAAPEPAEPEAKSEAAASGEAGAKPQAKGEAKPAGDEKAKPAAALQAKANELKKSIAQLERELNLSQREYKLRAAVYYADAGNSLRDPKKWAEEERQYQAETADKQKALDGAKQKLADLQEQARKLNVRIE